MCFIMIQVLSLSFKIVIKDLFFITSQYSIKKWIIWVLQKQHQIHFKTLTFTEFWGCRIYQLPLCWEVKSPPHECPGYDTKQSDGEVPVMLERWEMWSTPSVISLQCPLWLRVAAPDRVLSIDEMELNYVLMLNWVDWDRIVFWH